MRPRQPAHGQEGGDEESGGEEGGGTGTGDAGRERSGPGGARYSIKAAGLSHVQLLRFPDTSPDGPDDPRSTGHEPARIPLTGHNVYVDLAGGEAEVVVEGFRAEVLGHRPLTPGTAGPAPGPAFPRDRCEPMLTPDVEMFLDEDPPLVRPALDEHGTPARPGFRLPLRLGTGRETRIVLAPHTADRGLVDWRLIADVRCGGRRSSPHWDFQVTAETGRLSFHPDGREEFAPVHEVHDGAAHWKPAWPPESSPRPAGGPYARRRDAGDPREAGYLRSRREDDFDGCVRELLGMRVWLPLSGDGRDFTVARRDGERLVRAYTSVDRAGRLPRPEGEPATVQVHRFADLVRLWRHPKIGLVINPDAESELRLHRELFDRVTGIQDETG